MVWCGIIDTNIVGPYFFDDTVSANSYINMLQEFVLPELIRLGYNPAEIIYQNDGAPSHTAAQTRQWLTEHFESWIGQREGSEFQWPSRSPDLNPLDFFFWGFLEDIVYLNKPTDLEELHMKIDEAVDNVTHEMLENVQAHIPRRYLMVIERNGAHVEPYLR